LKSHVLTGDWLARFVFLVTSLFSLTWFDFKPIDYADMSLGTTLGHQTPAGLWALIVYTLYGINPHVYPGVPESPAGLSYLVILNAAHIVLPLWASQFVYVYVSLFIAQCGVYSLVKWVFTHMNTRLNSWAALLAAAFYAYGPYYQFYAGDGAIVILSFYAAFPWLMLFGLRAAESFGHSIKEYTGSLLGLALSAFYGSAGFTYYYHITGLGSILVVVVLYALFRKGIREKVLAVAGFVLAVFALELSQLYVIAPYFSAGPSLAQAGTSSPSLLGVLSVTSQLTDYLAQLTFSYFPAPQPWYPVHTNIPPVLHTPLWGLGVLLLILYPFLHGRIGRAKALLPFYALLFTGVLLGAGTNFPFGGVVAALFDAFWPVRAISVTFTSLQYTEQLAFAVLIAGSVKILKDERTVRRNVVYLEVGIICVLAVMSPYATGLPRGVALTYSHLPPNETGDRFYMINETVNIPAYYREMVSYVNSLPARGAVLTLPIVGNFHASTWYISVDNLASVLNKPVLGGGYISAPEFTFLVNTLIAWQQGLVQDVNLSALLSFEGIGYVVVQGDTLQGPFYSSSPPFNISFIEEALNQSRGVEQLEKFGPDVVYAVKGYAGEWQEGTPVEWLGVLLASTQSLTPNDSLPGLQPHLAGFSSGCEVYGKGSSLVFPSSVVGSTCVLNYTLPYTLPFYLSMVYRAQPNSTLVMSAQPENFAVFTLSQKGNITWEVYPDSKKVTLKLTLFAADVYSRGDALFLSNLSASYFSQNPSTSSLTSLGLVGPFSRGNQTFAFDRLKRTIPFTERCGLLSCEVVTDTTGPSILVAYGPGTPYETVTLLGTDRVQMHPASGSFYVSFMASGNTTAYIKVRNPNAWSEAISVTVFVSLAICYLTALAMDKKNRSG